MHRVLFLFTVLHILLSIYTLELPFTPKQHCIQVDPYPHLTDERRLREDMAEVM